MKKRIILAVATFLAFGINTLGQSAPANPPTQRFVVSGSAASFGGAGAASIASAGIQLTSSISVVSEFISNPTDSSKPRVGSGIVNYTRPAASFVPVKVRSKLLVDLTNYNLTFQAGAGKESFAAAVAGGPRTSRIIGNFGIFGSYPMPGGHSQIGLGYKWIVGAGGSTLVKIPTTTLNFTF